jgi:hypothetical protein
MSKPFIYIGIDTGVNTGIAIWNKDQKELVGVNTLAIHDAMEIVLNNLYVFGVNMFVRVEDARQRTWYGVSGKEKLQGAGSVKRDASIWEDFLKAKGIPFEMVAPKNNRTKMDAKTFSKATGWNGRCSNHARDAAMLVYGY